MNSFFPFEPQVRVGLCEGSAFGLSPHGDYNIDASEDTITYTPLSPDSFMEVKGMTIGCDFHWQQKRDLCFKGLMQLTRKDEVSMLINVVKAEEYLKSVICSEMSPNAPLEFLKAHAIISRSWLMRILTGSGCKNSAEAQEEGKIITFTQNDKHRHYDVCADDHCQRYQGISDLNEAALAAVKATRGLVLTDVEGNIADTRFSKCCGGHTELFSSVWNDYDPPYLPANECEFCNPQLLNESEAKALAQCRKDYDSGTDYYRWQTLVPPSLIARRLKLLHGLELGEITNLTPIKRGPSGRIVELKITGTLGSIIIGKELSIRKVLSDSHLLSSAFEVEKTEEGFRLTGRGWGHGVGLCQTGAALMALRGYTAAEILGYYYPTTSITPVYD